MNKHRKIINYIFAFITCSLIYTKQIFADMPGGGSLRIQPPPNEFETNWLSIFLQPRFFIPGVVVPSIIIISVVALFKLASNNDSK